MHRRVPSSHRFRSHAPRAARSILAMAVACAGFAVVLAPLAFLAPVEARAQAQGAVDQKAVVDYRQLVMAAVGSNMGAIGAILKNQLVLPGAISNHAQQMADSAKLMGPAFKQRVTAGKTDAKPAIWKDWAKFERAIADYEKAALALAGAAKGSDPAATGAAVKALGESCTGCHDAFRKPKEQSYKNR